MDQLNDNFSEFPQEEWVDVSASVSPEQLKVLIVEDDEMMRRLIGRALAGFGFTQVLIAEDGSEGLAAAAREKPDIIISDYHMPGMHGLQMVEALRGDCSLDHAIIIMLSAADDQHVIEQARDLGADTFMVKPFARDDLKRLIGTLYGRFNCAQIQWPE
jgi:two-component system, chemotaxis family, chemotaxis protein CheY